MNTIRRNIISAVAGVAASLSLGVGMASAQSVGMGTMGQGTSSYAAGAALSQILAQEAGLNVTVLPSSGETTVIPLVNSGETEFGLSSIMEVINAVEGEGVFAGRAQENVQLAAVLHPLTVGFYVRADSDIHTIADLAGRRVTTDFTAMGTIDLVAQAILASGGISYQDVNQVSVPNVVRGADDFIAGRADAFFFALGAGKVLEADASVGGLRLLQIDDDPEALDRMLEIFPYGYILEEPANPNAPGQAEASRIFSYDNLLIVNADVPEETVRTVIQTIVENADAIREGAPVLRRMDPAEMHKDHPLTYHPGALAYFEEAGLLHSEE